MKKSIPIKNLDAFKEEKGFQNLTLEDIVFQGGGNGSSNSPVENFCVIKGKYYCKTSNAPTQRITPINSANGKKVEDTKNTSKTNKLTTSKR